jgi:hypothetical protein
MVRTKKPSLAQVFRGAQDYRLIKNMRAEGDLCLSLRRPSLAQVFRGAHDSRLIKNMRAEDDLCLSLRRHVENLNYHEL